MKFLVEFGQDVKKGRKENDLTQEKLAEICGVSTRTISNIENGKSEPKFGTLVRICAACRIGIEKPVQRYIEEKEIKKL